MRKLIVATLLAASSMTVAAQPVFAETEAVAADPAKQKLAETMAGKIIPPGSYEKMMKDMSVQLADSIIAQMLGMDASTFAMAKEGDTSATDGRTVGELAADADPNFKERMEIMMRVTFDEMGKLMTEMEPAARGALANVYARKYTAAQLTDMNGFFATPSGSVFAADFMSTFTDKEMMSAMMGQMPKMMEAMPEIMKKVEAATAHLTPPPPTSMIIEDDSFRADSATIAAAKDPFANESGTEPWWDRDNWDKADQKKIADLESKANTLAEQSETTTAAYLKFETEVMLRMRERYLANGWKPSENSE
jgi:hypothetical protein